MVSLFTYLLTTRSLPPISLTIDDGDVISQKNQLRQHLSLPLSPKGIRDSDLHSGHETLLYNTHLLSLMIVDRNQNSQRMFLIRSAGCCQHVGTVLQPNHS